jgi:hypothetical protein
LSTPNPVPDFGFAGDLQHCQLDQTRRAQRLVRRCQQGLRGRLATVGPHDGNRDRGVEMPATDHRAIGDHRQLAEQKFLLLGRMANARSGFDRIHCPVDLEEVTLLVLIGEVAGQPVPANRLR